MNERIKEILSQCQLESIDGPEYPRWTDLEKFAELIVAECMQVANTYQNRGGNIYVDNKIAEHFGVKE